MILRKIVRRINKVYIRSRLRPIHVFCLHQISDIYDPVRCYAGDWISTNEFKSVIDILSSKYSFISLTEAKRKLKRDWFRWKEYAVLTFDDGYASIYPSLEWIERRGIPYTLFINAKYLDGSSCSKHILKHAKEQCEGITESEVVKGLYLSENDILKRSSRLCEVGSHGFEHIDASRLSPSGFADQVSNNLSILLHFNSFVPFYAYTWGHHSDETDRYLNRMKLTPVLMDGQMNFKDSKLIHRELFPSLDTIQ